VSTVIWTALFIALETRAAGGISSELRVGYAPTTLGATSEATVVSSTNPSLTLFAFDTVKTVSLSYSPRILFRQPNIQNELGPVIFHQAAFNASQRLSRTAVAGAGATGGVGEVDYTGLQQALNNTGVNVPRTNRIAQAAGHAELKIKIAPSVFSINDLRASLFAPLTGTSSGTTAADASTPAQPGALLPTQTMVDAGSIVTTQVSANSSVGAGARAAFYHSNNGLRLLVLSPGVDLVTILGRYLGELRVSMGLSFVRDLSENVPGKRSESRALPISGVSLLNRLVDTTGIKLSSELGFSTTFFVDPTVGKGRLRGQADARLRATFSRQWSASLEAMFVTSLMKHPLLQGDPALSMIDPTTFRYPFETQLMLVLPVRWQPSADFSMEAGARFIERGPHLAAPSFGLRERESWIYLLATLGFDFTRSRPGSTPR